MESYLTVRTIEKHWLESRKGNRKISKQTQSEPNKAQPDQANDADGAPCDVGADTKVAGGSGKRSQAGYQTQYHAFIQDNFPAKFSRFDGYLAALGFFKRMSEGGMWDDYFSCPLIPCSKSYFNNSSALDHWNP